MAPGAQPCVGMLTLENVLEELVGQIQDEFDHEKPRLTRRSDESWDLEGSLPLFELSELAGMTVEAEGITTVNGWVIHRLGRFPRRCCARPQARRRLCSAPSDARGQRR